MLLLRLRFGYCRMYSGLRCLVMSRCSVCSPRRLLVRLCLVIVRLRCWRLLILRCLRRLIGCCILLDNGLLLMEDMLILTGYLVRRRCIGDYWPVPVCLDFSPLTYCPNIVWFVDPPVVVCGMIITLLKGKHYD